VLLLSRSFRQSTELFLKVTGFYDRLKAPNKKRPPQPFQAIFSRRAYQSLPLDRREELARRFFRWLRPGGVAFVETLNVRAPNRKSCEDPFRAAGFYKVQRWSQVHPDKRCVLFWHGSG
jgi:hypothetical protein